MKNIILLTTIAVVFSVSNLFTQQVVRDVIYLKNGSIIKGIIVEQVPGVSYKIEMGDGGMSHWLYYTWFRYN